MVPASILIEILIVGLFLLIAISPICIGWNKKLRTEPGVFPGLAELAVSKQLIVLIMLLVYSLGILGNRLIDDLYSDGIMEKCPFEKFIKLQFLRSDRWSKSILKTVIETHDPELYNAIETHNPELDKVGDKAKKAKKVKKAKRDEIYKVAEFRLMQYSPAAKAWLERHKSFIRVLRAGSFSTLLFLICIGLYKIMPNCGPRYTWRLNMTILLLFVLFHVGWRFETYGYQERVVLLFLNGGF